MLEKIQIPSRNSLQLSVLYNTPKEQQFYLHNDTLIIMIHGLGAHKSAHGDIFGDIESLLAESHYHTLRFDFSGCGQSDGEKGSLTLAQARDDLESIHFWAERKEYKDVVYIAEGLGAAIALSSSTLENVKAITLLWPLLDLAPYGKAIYKEAHSSHDIKEDGIINYKGIQLNTKLLHELSKLDMTPALKSATMPLQVMYGLQDEDISPDNIDLLRGAIGSKRVEITSFHDGTKRLPKLSHRKTLFHYLDEFIVKNA